MLNWITSKCSYSSQFLHEKGWPNRFHVQDELSRSIRIEGYLWHSHLPRCLLLCSTKQIFCKQNEDWDITVFPERSPSVVFLPLISFVQPWVSAEYNAVVLVPKFLSRQLSHEISFSTLCIGGIDICFMYMYGFTTLSNDVRITIGDLYLSIPDRQNKEYVTIMNGSNREFQLVQQYTA